MKKIYTILMTLIFTTMFSQLTPEIKYPKFEVDSLGQKVIVMTIPQAMKLNNNSDLLEKFEAQDIKIKEYETLCVRVISEKDEVIGSRRKAAGLPVKETTDEKCNHTAKGKKCPVHGLKECGSYMEGKKPDFLDMDKDGDKKEPMKKAVADKKGTAPKKGVNPFAKK